MLQKNEQEQQDRGRVNLPIAAVDQCSHGRMIRTSAQPQLSWVLAWHARAAQVNTLKVEGMKKRGKYGFFRRPDYKKAFVVLKEQQPGSGVQPQ